MGHEQMEDGEPFCLLAQAVSEQQDQWWQDYWQRSYAHQQSGYDSVKDVGRIVTAERQLFGSAVPPIAKSARGTCGNQSHGSQAGPFGVPHVAPWDEIREYVDKGAEVYEFQHRQHQINSLKRKAAMLGFQVTEVPAA